MRMNVPNALSTMRIVLIPFFLYTYLTAQHESQYVAAAVILAVSGLTDTVDGWIARHFNMITQLGKILDPVADKLTLAAVVAALWIQKPHLWPLYALFIAKEVLMLLGGLRLHHKKITIEGAKWFGKLGTILFYIVMIIIVAVPQLTDRTIVLMLAVLLAVMLFALLQYVFLFRRLIRSDGGKAS